MNSRRQQRRPNSLMQVAAAVVGSAAAAQVVGQADEHTYPTGQTPGAYEMPHRLDVIGSNNRRLIVTWTADGLYLGGCLVASREDAETLARFITRESDQ